MRYTVLTFRTFHHRITRYLGVLVGAALVATLGLPSAVQAQTTDAPMVKYVDATDTFMVSQPHPVIGPENDAESIKISYYWVLEVDGPVSVPDMVGSQDGKVEGTFDPFIVQAKGTDGDWMFRLATGVGKDDGTDKEDLLTIDASEVTDRNTGPWLSHMHGRPDAPEGFAYAKSGTTHVFTWENAIPRKPNVGVVSYWLRWTSGDPALAATKWTAHKDAIKADFYRLSSTQAKALKDGEMYTFELTALGTSSSTTKTLTSAAATELVPIGMVPTPTLPETAALLLGLLLLGSGAYLIRRRQSSGLISA